MKGFALWQGDHLHWGRDRKITGSPSSRENPWF